MQKNNEKWVKLSCKRRKKRIKRKRLKRLVASAYGYFCTVRVLAPRTIMLRRKDTHKDVTDFLIGLRSKIRSGAREILVDFSRTENIYPGGGLLIYAEIKRCVSLYPRIKFYCREARNNRVSQVLQHLKIYEMLRCDSKVVPMRDDVIKWRHASAQIIDGQVLGELIAKYPDLSKSANKLLYEAGTEAMTNSIMHAYIEPRRDGLINGDEKNWWMFCREDDDHFYMSICDLGVGIPRTLKAKNFEIFREILDKLTFGKIPNDAQMIRGAMQYARTRTNLPNRGKGLQDIIEIIEKQQVGSVAVYSNKGCVRYGYQSGYDESVFENSIRGTLIVWSIPLQDMGVKNAD